MKIKRMKRQKLIALRLNDAEWARLIKVQDNIALSSRGQRPELVEIIRSILGLGNRGLVSAEERAFFSGDTPNLHGPFAPKRNKP